MIRKNVAEILAHHVTFELEATDRMYLNAYVPSLQTGGGIVYFLKTQLGVRVPSTVMVAPMSERFVAALERFVETQGLDLVTFEKGQRKDDVAKEYLATFEGDEGVLFVGKAQEKASVFRTEKATRRGGEHVSLDHPLDGDGNHYYVYILDRDFGPLFLKFCSYFPYPAKLCLNGHEWLKRQLTQREVPFEPLDNGIRSSDEAGRVQRIADTLDAAKIDAVFRKWLRRVPHPFAPAHRAAGYRYQLSILQAEFALTQVLDRPLTGRCFFEEVIRENLDLGRPDQMQLIFDRRITRRTPGRFRTRVLTEGVVPSLHVEYKKSKVKQYHKEGQALRTETTINDTYDFAIGRALRNLPARREIGFAANRRLLHVESLSHDCLIGEDHLHAVTSPVLLDAAAVLADHGDPITGAAVAMFAREELGRSRILRELADHVDAGSTISDVEVRGACDDHVRKQSAGGLSTTLRAEPPSGVDKALRGMLGTDPGSPSWIAATQTADVAVDAKRKRDPQHRHSMRTGNIYVDLNAEGSGWLRPCSRNTSEALSAIFDAVNDYAAERDRLRDEVINEDYPDMARARSSISPEVLLTAPRWPKSLMAG